MSNPVTIKTEVIITVPAKLWPRVSKALAVHHRDRHKSWADSFWTNGAACNFAIVALDFRIKNHPATAAFWMQAHLHMPVPFTGEITFLKAGTEH